MALKTDCKGLVEEQNSAQVRGDLGTQKPGLLMDIDECE
jgi:hypothetical protein